MGVKVFLIKSINVIVFRLESEKKFNLRGQLDAGGSEDP